MILKKSICIILFFGGFLNVVNGQFKNTTFNLFSTAVKDSFEIYISLPKQFTHQKKYEVIYYLDANIKSGKALRALLKNPNYNTLLTSKIFVGIGHIGDFHKLRQRDFLPATIKGNDTIPKNKNYGHAEDFYTFLTKELMPFIKKTYNINDTHNSLIGHSYAGFFCFYSLFKNDAFFENYYALSPSLWEANYSIFAFNKIKQTGFNKKKNIYFTAGGLEFANYILTGNKKMNDYLLKKNYTNLAFKYDIVPYQNHNTAVPISLKEVLQQIGVQ